MATNTHSEIIKECFDLLSDFPYLTNTHEKASLFNSLINELESYPKRQQIEPTNEALGACLYVLNAQNALTLGLIGCYSYARAAVVVYDNLESALSLLLDKT